MIRINIPFFYKLGVSLNALRGVKTGSDLASVWSILYTALQDINNMFAASWLAPALKTTLGPGKRLADQLNEITENFDFSKPRTITAMEAYRLSQAVEEFETVLRNELQNADTFFVTRKAAYDTSLLLTNAELLFSAEVASKVTAAIPDIREAGKCLAYELNTASGFHIMRAVETVLRSYWDVVAKGATRPRQQNLGVYLKKMEDKKLGTAKVRASLTQLETFTVTLSSIQK